MPQKIHMIARRTGESEGGQTMAEYTVVLGVITLAIVTTIGLLSGGVQGILEQVAGLFS